MVSCMTFMIAQDVEHDVFMVIGPNPNKTNTYEKDYSNLCYNSISSNF